MPLYPQYSSAATESSVRECERILKRINPQLALEVINPFYSHDGFINAFTQVTEEALKNYTYDHLLFSFHGLPERQIKKTTKEHCLSVNTCCEKINETNSNCYRAQCYQTAKLMAHRLGLSQDKYTVCFQSRLGRTPWIRPFTDEFYRELPKKGVKKLAVVCPSFVADCLETLEEVQIRGKEEFIRNGGEDLLLVPSLNSSPIWAKGIRNLVLNPHQLNFSETT